VPLAAPPQAVTDMIMNASANAKCFFILFLLSKCIYESPAPHLSVHSQVYILLFYWQSTPKIKVVCQATSFSIAFAIIILTRKEIA
jgi:hypothetical protein